MANFVSKFTALIEADGTGAVRELGKISKAADKANTDAGKSTDGLKSKIAGFASSISPAALTGGLVAAGGAVATFAVKAVTQFENLGVAVGKFHDATGVSNEDASKFINLADDLGVGADTLQSAIGKMNKAAGSTPGVFQDAGIAIAYAKDGSVDANQTFLNTVDALTAIKDPADRATLATKIFGKGYQQAAQIIFGGSAQIKASFDSINKAQIFDDAKVAKARAVQASFADLGDAVQSLELKLGEELAPALVTVANALGKVVDYSDVVLNFSDTTKEAADNTGGWLGKVARGSQTLGQAIVDTFTYTGKQKDHKKATDDVATATDDLAKAQSAQNAQANAAVLYLNNQATAAQKLSDTEKDQLVKSSLAAYDAGKKLADQQAALGQANREAASDADLNSLALFSLDKAMGDAATSASAYETALQELAGNYPSVEKATIDYKGAVDDAAKSLLDQKGNLDKTKLGLDDNTKAGRDNLTALDDLATKAFDLQGAQKKAGASTDALSGLLAFQRQDFIKVAEKMGATSKQAETLADKYGLIPKNVQTAVKQVGIDDVRTKLANLRSDISEPMLQYINTQIANGQIAEVNRELDGIANKSRTVHFYGSANTHDAELELNYAARDRTSHIYTTQTVTSRIDPGAVAPYPGGWDGDPKTPYPHANGGVARGLALVGERGPELVNFGQSSRVFTAQQTAALAGGGANVTINVNAGMGADGQQIARTIVEHLKAYTRTNGPIPIKVAA